MPRLIVRPGKPDERVVELAPGAYCIGRAPDCEVPVAHPSLSRRHARLLVDDGVVVEDLGSRNGTFVDGVRVERMRLGAAHYLRCGEVVFSFVGGSATSATRTSGDLTPSATLFSARGRSLHELVAGPRRDAARRLEILLEVSEVLSSPGPLEALLERVLSLTFAILPADRATLVLDGEPRISLLRDGPAPEHVLSRRIVDYAVERGVAVLFDDVGDDPRLCPTGSIARQSIRAAMCAPLATRDGAVLGALYVDNLSSPGPFSSDDLALMSAFARQVGIALHNASLGRRLAQEAVERAQLRRFFPPATLDAILRHGVEPVQTEATLLFCDIVGFTGLSARRDPRAIIGMLNAYFPIMAEIVFRHEGTLEKYIGDALLAAWGAPTARVDDAVRAMEAAVAMQVAVTTLDHPFGDPLQVHIGLASGPVAAGNIGTPRYLQYATIGSVTNLASRICDVAQPGEIVIDATTRSRLSAGGFRFEALPPHALAGFDEPRALFRLVR